MECNRDEANRAKEIAEKKFSDKDIKGAKKFALKAQNLFPGLDGISQFLATLDVYASAENKINGELDYYGILGVSPLSDDDTVKKHYRKLALSLHPDKNKSVGAEGAFHFVQEAFNLLSDKDKRRAYDSTRNSRVFKHVFETQNGPKNGYHNFTKSTAARTKIKTTKTKGTSTKTKKAAKVNSPKDDIYVAVNTDPMGPTSIPSSSDNKQVAPSKTFWTVCMRCKLQYEFGRMYLNRNLLCPTCHGPFHATETPAPDLNNADLAYGSSSQWAPVSIPTSPSPADVAQAETMVKQTYTGVKRDREESQAAKKEEAQRKKIAKKEANLLSKQQKSVKTKKGVNGFDENKETGTIGSSNCSTQVEVKKVASKSGVKNPLIKKATTEIKKKLNEWNSETVKSSLENGDSKNHETEPLVIDVPDSDGTDPDIDVPDSDFHDFDCDRSEKCFKQGQVWAAYDDRDGLPRSYALIQKIISLEPFKMKLTWLNSKPEKAFGEFKPGMNKIVVVPNYFSHRANFTKQENGNVFIFPKKGDVCALYTDLEQLKYELVEVDEFDKETGTTVTPLVKVAGFKTVFHRHIDPNQTKVICEKEMVRFSHQIPSYLLTGQESANAPKGCRELDPAAIPPEFVQVTENGENGEKVDEAEKPVNGDCVLADVKVADNMNNTTMKNASSTDGVLPI